MATQAAPDDRLAALVARHRPTLDAAIEAVSTRAAWSPYSDSPSTKIHGAEKPAAGKAAFEARLGTRFEIDQPGIADWVGAEVSPYTRTPLGITYPQSDPAALIAAATAAIPAWRKTDWEVRVALCLEIAARLYARNFEMAQAVMHVAGQSYVQAFAGSGPNALDRGVEALAYAAKAMADVTPHTVWRRRFGADDVALDKTYAMVPRGVGLVICCASFPTWNAYPAMFADLATGNPVIVKPHPIAVLPMAIVVEEARATLAEHGFDPNLVTLAVDTVEAPVAQRFIDDPAIGIVDFTGSPRYGQQLERTVTGKLLFTETAGVNSVVIESVADLAQTATAIARSTSLFSAQMCTSPQTIFVPRDGIRAGEGHASFDEVATAIVSAVDAVANDPAVAAGIMGAIQGQVSIDVIDRLRDALGAQDGAAVLRDAAPYPHPEYPDARTLTPLIATVDGRARHLYAEEQFGPVLFIVAVDDADAAVAEATELAATRGTISTYLYSTDEGFIARSTDAYEEAGANLSINLHGAMWINFAAAYSDYHVTGLNPAGNACLADLAFVASRFRIVQRRRPAA
ncbi:phenylacetic acid degradation protein PaaN [Allosphingosinicella indica]|uniref:Phenylacetic acid degradation protein paaN n=1 Tax=Allosphingosinicella indica TaxID=941907 RepID=A0A1X7FZZ4_9SPHN|nr:phenylacetic acid degradation protein PaaN [Allosphingosinicella indica]SMF61700.1 phenylacetic acid degradation protein paaN [Allosphingosinicella indica]